MLALKTKKVITKIRCNMKTSMVGTKITEFSASCATLVFAFILSHTVIQQTNTVIKKQLFLFYVRVKKTSQNMHI